MLLFFALAALLMAALATYGVVSYAVRQATVEIGTRMALGATGRDLLLMVVGGGLKMAAYGALIGAVGIAASAWLLVRAFEIPDLGALPFVISSAVVGIVTTLASFFPGMAGDATVADGRHPERAGLDVAVDASDTPANVDWSVQGRCPWLTNGLCSIRIF